MSSNTSSISSLSSSNASNNGSRPSDAFLTGSWRTGGPKAGEKRPRGDGVAKDPPRDIDTDNNLLGDLSDEVQFEKTEMKKDPIAGASLNDVVFTVEMVNPHKRINPKKPRSETDYTRLVLIASVSAKGLLLDDLKRFATRIGIQGHRSWGKQKVCEAIVARKINPNQKEATNNKKKKAVVPINRKRFINVLFCETFQPKLANRGKSLNKDQLTDGIKTDELLFRDFVVLYNNKDQFNDDEFPELDVRGDPSSFSPITWEAARKFFRELMKDYDICLANWKRSGNHGAFAENQKKPFADFKKNRGNMLYLHEFAYQVPDILQHALTQLNAEAFYESISDDETAPVSELATSSKKKKKQTPRKNSGEAVAAALLAISNDTKARNKVQKYAFVVEMENNTSKVIREHKAEWKRVLSEASAKKKKSRSFIKQDYNKYKAKKDNPPKRSAVDDILDSLSSDSDGGGSQLLSQQSDDGLDSVFEELYDIDKDIEQVKRRQAHLSLQANEIEDNSANKENETMNGGD